MRRLPVLLILVAVLFVTSALVIRPRSQRPGPVVLTALETPVDRAFDGYRLAPLAPAATFEQLVGVAAIPGRAGELLVYTKTGFVWNVARSAASEREPRLVANVAASLPAELTAEEGLLAVALSPAFERDRRAYLYYTAEWPLRSVLSRVTVLDGEVFDLATEEVLLEIEQPVVWHNGGGLAFGPDGHLYLGVGDGGGIGDPRELGQNPATLHGSILRLDVSGPDGYAIPADNPFVGDSTARPEIFAYGFRNPWQLSVDQVTGEVWVGDVGQERYEEVNRVRPGGNYGWGEMEGWACYRPRCGPEAFDRAHAVYGHSAGDCAITGGRVYRGSLFPELEGSFIYGDFCSGRIWRVSPGEPAQAWLLLDSGLPIASFGTDGAGELVIVTFARALYTLGRGGIERVP